MSAAAETWSTLLTASGVGAIGVIRVCGPDALSAISSLFRTEHAKTVRADSFSEGQLRYGRLVDGDEFLDDVLVSAVRGSTVSTFDITAHGGVRVLERILSALESHGAPFRVAPPDFMAFPVVNQIERDFLTALRHVRTARALTFLCWQRTALPASVNKLLNQISGDVAAARSALADMLARAAAARTLIHGISVVLTGPPNSGKSTLFNRLVGRPAAVVSPQPGTTRDWITADLDMHGLPVRLIDTAGIRVEAEALEREAMKRGWDVAGSATLRLLVLDATQPMADAFALTKACTNLPAAILFNKTDACTNAPPTPDILPDALQTVPVLRVSAATGYGLSSLSDLIHQRVGLHGNGDTSLPAFFADRQIRIAEAWLNSDPVASAAMAQHWHDRLFHESPVAC